MADTEKKFAKGFWAERPHTNAPDFVKLRVSVKVAEATEWLEANKSERGYVNMQLLLARDGEKLYFVLDEYKPKTSEENNFGKTEIQYPDEELNPNDVPF